MFVIGIDVCDLLEDVTDRDVGCIIIYLGTRIVIGVFFLAILILEVSCSWAFWYKVRSLDMSSVDPKNFLV